MMTTRLPEEFLTQIKDLLGDNEANLLAEALEQEPSVAIRTNTRKPCTLPQWADSCHKVAWSINGRYLDERPQFTFTPQLHAGGFYVQDASSMIHELILKQIAPEHPICYLDLCAAPGGKTTAAINMLAEGSLVVANEYVPMRSQILKENIQKWGYPNVIVTNSSVERLCKTPGLYDIIAIDAPCSGEGMMRKDEEARRQWSSSLVEDCAALQWQIICDSWDTLKEDGYLIYSTCTFNRQENEEMVDRICSELGAESIRLDIEENWGIQPGLDTSHHCYRFMQHHTRGEGLFVAVLRKTTEQKDWQPRKSKRPAKPPKLPTINWLSGNDWHFTEHNGTICAISREYAPILEELTQLTKVIMAGIEVATVKGKDLIPQHGLALSISLQSDAFPRVELDYPTAINYLQREAITLPDGSPRGFVIVCHESMPLGFVKNLGNRANNLYPQEWRIRTSLPK